MNGVYARALARTARISVEMLADVALRRVDRKVVDARLHGWARDILADARTTIDVTGRENLPSNDTSLVVMSNHQSHSDILVLFATLPGSMRMVAKAELFRVPIWGAAMREAGFIRLDRSDRSKSIEALRKSADGLRDGARVWIAPEGTRSKTGDVGPFKSGGFWLALEKQVPILPVAIWGTRDVHALHSTEILRDKTVHVSILPPWDTKSYGLARRHELTEGVRSAISTEVERLRRDA